MACDAKALLQLMMLSKLVRRERRVECAYWQKQELFREDSEEKR